MSDFVHEIKLIAASDASEAVRLRFLSRLDEPGYTRDENPASHYCVYFLPYNLKTKEVFLIHHRKSGLWIFPGGHIDKGEIPIETLNREVMEELGVSGNFSDATKSFHLSVTHIDRPTTTCREHLDIWFAFDTDGSDFNVDPKEFITSRWMKLKEVRELITDISNLEAVEKIEKVFIS